MTNLVSIFSSWLPHQVLALHLMLGEADFVSKSLNLPVPHPLKAEHLIERFVGHPTYGINGSIQTTNVAVTFWEGQLHTITRTDLYPPSSINLTRQQNILTRNTLTSDGAHQIVTQWLAAISVDIRALEQQLRAQVRSTVWKVYDNSTTATTRRSRENQTDQKSLTIYEVIWSAGKNADFTRPPVKVTVLGNTKELIDLQLADRSFLRRPILQGTNQTNDANAHPAPKHELNSPTTNKPAAAGPWKYPRWAPPRDLSGTELSAWMERFLGGNWVVEALKSPDSVKVYRLGDFNAWEGIRANPEAYPVRRGPWGVNLEKGIRLGEELTNPNNYDWRVNAFAPKYTLRLQFVRQSNVVDVLVALDETTAVFYSGTHRTPEVNFRPAKKEILELIEQTVR